MSTGTGTGYTAEDRRVTKVLIAEKEERVKAVEELHKALKKEEDSRTQSLAAMQKSIDDLSKKLDGVGRSNGQAPSPGPDRETKGMLALLEEKLAKQQSQMEGQTKMLQQHTQQLQELYNKSEKAVTMPASMQTPAAKGSETSLNGNAETRLKEVEDLQGQQVQQLTALRSLVVEVHVNLLLHAVKASRIALRCTDLSKEERRLALQSLDAKERLVREDIGKISERFDLTAAGVLKTITGDMIMPNVKPDGPSGSNGGGGNRGAVSF